MKRNSLLALAKKIIPTKDYKRIKSLSKKERQEVLPHVLKINLQKKIEELENHLTSKDNRELIPQVNLIRLKSKLKAFIVSKSEEDLNKIYHLYQDTKEALNV